MGSFPNIRTNIGEAVDWFVDFLATTFEGFFDFIFFISSRTISGIDDFIVWLPWWLFIIMIVLLGWYFKSVFAGILFGFFVYFIGTFVLCVELMIMILIIINAVFV